MNFQELEDLVQKEETEARKRIVPKLKKAAAKIPLDLILGITLLETISSTHPRINKDGDKLKIAILQTPNLRGKFYVEMEHDKLGLFRDGYENPLVSYKEPEIKIAYDNIIRVFWSGEMQPISTNR